MKRICIESPLSGDFAKNIEYARRCERYVLDLGHAPFVSHLLYTQVLDDRDLEQRKRGLEAGLAMGDSCDERWFFLKGGELSRGMVLARDRAVALGQAYMWCELPEGVVISPTPGLMQLNEVQHRRLRKLCSALEDKSFSNAAEFDGHWFALERVLCELDGGKFG